MCLHYSLVRLYSRHSHEALAAVDHCAGMIDVEAPALIKRVAAFLNSAFFERLLAQTCCLCQFAPPVSSLLHEGNSEQLFSLSGRLADPNLDPRELGILAKIASNGRVFKPTYEAILDRYTWINSPRRMLGAKAF